MRALTVLILLILAPGVGGCSIPAREPAVPVADTERALPLGIPNARFFADSDPRPMIEDAERALEREIAALPPGKRLGPAHFLAVSGGGDNGAFGAGLLNGWTETGTRPQFKGVTGVSTGALIAPFAFLGPEYDGALRDVYTTMNADRVFRFRGLSAALFDDAMADTTPLSEVIAKYLDQKLLDAIAAEYRKGRLLLIGTTNLDAQRPVIWNIGAIADSGHPGALDLIRKILRASAAVPGAFQPMLIDVELDGKKYQELHVDGGAIAQLFLYPPSLQLSQMGLKRERHAYIIRNARLDPDFAQSERRTISIAGRAISTMLSASGHNDVMRVYFISRRDGVDYNLEYIGRDFQGPEKKGEFDQAFMRALYDYGYRQGNAGPIWHKAPPALDRGVP
ncbi:MAG: patatin-like phospholipase family protein [Reyranella sp.]|nr:patatin-like phospholipase family protein [Reyranella sp.]